MELTRHEEVHLTVVACFAIGLGAVLTPVGEPLSTIVTAKLHGDFWLLAREFGWYIVPGVAVLSVWAAFTRTRHGHDPKAAADPPEAAAEIWIRTGKVYAFVAALVLLGRGLVPLVDRFIAHLPAALLFWVNMVSAILDNATLAAAEISPAMDMRRITAVLLGLLISGGMLIPGNIPNIVSANHLKITSKEWARFGVPLGLVLMAAYFVVWSVLG
jgi:predicted cation transporter